MIATSVVGFHILILHFHVQVGVFVADNLFLGLRVYLVGSPQQPSRNINVEVFTEVRFFRRRQEDQTLSLPRLGWWLEATICSAITAKARVQLEFSRNEDANGEGGGGGCNELVATLARFSYWLLNFLRLWRCGRDTTATF